MWLVTVQLYVLLEMPSMHHLFAFDMTDSKWNQQVECVILIIFPLPYGHDKGQPVLQIPHWDLWQPKDCQREQEVEKVERGQRDQELVEVGAHLGAREDKDAQDVAWKENEFCILRTSFFFLAHSHFNHYCIHNNYTNFAKNFCELTGFCF